MTDKLVKECVIRVVFHSQGGEIKYLKRMCSHFYN